MIAARAPSLSRRPRRPNRPNCPNASALAAAVISGPQICGSHATVGSLVLIAVRVRASDEASSLGDGAEDTTATASAGAASLANSGVSSAAPRHTINAALHNLFGRRMAVSLSDVQADQARAWRRT